MIDNKTAVYGLLGFPIKHSLSPAMHNAALRELNLPGEYQLFEVKPEELDHFLSSLDKSNIYGLNVTVPYKEKVLNFVTLDQESHYLRKIRAVNTIVRQDKVWKGFNTDVSGFWKHLKEVFSPSGKSVALLGAGGAARAVVYVLASSDAAQIVVFDIDKNKAKNVTDMVKGLFPDFEISCVDSIEDLHIENKDLLINATPVGLKEDDPCLVKEEVLHRDLFVYDLIYNPAETKLLSLAKNKGARICSGLDMLVYQGALSFCLFTGTRVKIDQIIGIMKKAAQKELKKRC